MLLRAIVGQQLSTKAAAAIWTRVAGLFEEEMPTPQHVLDASPEELRAAGLSRAKVVYMKSLAEHVLSGQLELDRLDQLRTRRSSPTSQPSRASAAGAPTCS